jgi:hypothetical protein
MRLSSLIHFATFGIQYVTALSMSFDIRAQLDQAVEAKVSWKHESEEEFVEAPRWWSYDSGNLPACVDEAGTIKFGTSRGECGDKSFYPIFAAFPRLIKGKNLVHISTPDYTLSVSGHFLLIICLSDVPVQFYCN